MQTRQLNLPTQGGGADRCHGGSGRDDGGGGMWPLDRIHARARARRHAARSLGAPSQVVPASGGSSVRSSGRRTSPLKEASHRRRCRRRRRRYCRRRLAVRPAHTRKIARVSKSARARAPIADNAAIGATCFSWPPRLLLRLEKVGTSQPKNKLGDARNVADRRRRRRHRTSERRPLPTVARATAASNGLMARQASGPTATHAERDALATLRCSRASGNVGSGDGGGDGGGSTARGGASLSARSRACKHSAKHSSPSPPLDESEQQQTAEVRARTVDRRCYRLHAAHSPHNRPLLRLHLLRLSRRRHRDARAFWQAAA